MKFFINLAEVVAENLKDAVEHYLSRHHGIGNDEYLNVKYPSGKKEVIKLKDGKISNGWKQK